jgi:hypothetical protein
MKRKKNNILDLHGVKHSEVINRLSQYLFWENPGWDQYIIITGNSKKMQDIVLKWLDSHEYNYYIPTHNLGEIQISE